MIVSIYPEILTSEKLNIINLEDKYFDKLNSNWYLNYCNLALDLEKQGYAVIISSDKLVRDYMKLQNKKYFVILYSPELKDYVLRKVEATYNDTGLEKDLKTLKHIKENFDNDIQNLLDDNQLRRYIIYKENYNLEAIIKKLQEE